jgi:hypothetical protein
MMTEDGIFKIICEEREKFHRESPGRTTNDLWQGKAAQRIAAYVRIQNDELERVRSALAAAEAKGLEAAAQFVWPYDKPKFDNIYWSIAQGIRALRPPAAPAASEKDPLITGMLCVGFVRFHPGVRTSTVQGAIDRAFFEKGVPPVLLKLDKIQTAPLSASEPAGVIDGNCPRCGSSRPGLHPAVQHEGEVQICPHPFHLLEPAGALSEEDVARAIHRHTHAGGMVCLDAARAVLALLQRSKDANDDAN